MMFIERMFISKRMYLYLTLNTYYEIFWDFSKEKTAIVCYCWKMSYRLALWEFAWFFVAATQNW